MVMAAGFSAAYALVGLFRHWHFSSSAFDLGIFDQAIWHLSRFEVPASTISGYSNILGDHFYPIIAAFAPLYWVAPAPETLIVAQAILLACSIVPVYLFLRARFPAGPSLTLSAAYGCFWGLQRTAWFDVHEMAFAPVLIALAILAVDRRNWRLLWLASATLLLVKEDLIPLVSGFGVYLMLIGERRRGAVLTVLSLLWFFAVVFFVIPSLSDAGAWAYSGAYDAVWHRPWMAPVLMLTPAEKIHTIVLWLAPFLFLPLCSPLGMLLVPVAVERLLSASPNHWGHGAHYSAPLAPILAMAAADGLARLARRRVITGAAVASLVVSAILPGHQPILRLFAPKHYQRPRFQDTGEQALLLIPRDASVVAQAAIVPHLSQRAQIFVLDAKAPDADYVIASTDLSPWPALNTGDISRLIDERKERGYQPVFEHGGWVVLKR